MKIVLVFSILVLALPTQALKPDRTYHTLPDSLGLKYEQKQLRTSDGTRLLSWILPTPATKSLNSTLVFAYADTGNMGNYLYQAQAFLKAGFDVVLFDYRGFGQSADFPINENQLYYNEFTDDLKTALRAAQNRFPKNRVGIFSISMGTIPATYAAIAQPVDFLIADGYVRSPQQLAAFWKKSENIKLVLPVEAEAFPAQSQKIMCPMLFIAGTEDDVTPLAWAEAVAAQRPNRRVFSYKGWHVEGMKVLTEREFADGYVRRIREFVEALPQRP